ncbi:Hypothetical protein PHPALM_11398 [Phytophthora palmivora]|uniref:SWIM-type domain-containing protein n=1 Tax=Phytophthora palmivora TaxID=4796 RepID=A0A2P4Y2C6_9STRA|nr:Hypothetical protein PHPALM_11398 [Phytophthora palmivora]
MDLKSHVNFLFYYILCATGASVKICGLCMKLGHVSHVGNHTNNRHPTYRLETAWGNLKEILKPEMDLDVCTETLIFLQSTAEFEYTARFRVVGSPKGYEPFKRGYLTYEGRWLQDGIFQLRSGASERDYVVNISTYMCSCFFVGTMLPLCHHTIFIRSNLKKKKMIFINYIPPH